MVRCSNACAPSTLCATTARRGESSRWPKRARRSPARATSRVADRTRLSVSADRSELSVGNAEDPLDALWIADGDLNVCLLMEARSLVHRPTFDEDALHAIDRLFATITSNGVNHLKHRAVQRAQQTRGSIFG